MIPEWAKHEYIEQQKDLSAVILQHWWRRQRDKWVWV